MHHVVQKKINASDLLRKMCMLTQSEKYP